MPTHADYTIGWICALTIEMTAAVAMLDEEHPPIKQHERDTNSYTLGRIGEHNVVITCLAAGKTGTHTAAIVGTHLTRSFPRLRFVLMVGIGGGCPSDKKDIRLGDIIVSKPGPKNGGVVQYDFGRTVEGGRFVPTGSLNRPPTLLLTALAKLQSKTELEDFWYVRYLSNIPRPLVEAKFGYPGAEKDLLFEPKYGHIEGDGCRNCDRGKLKIREDRDSHYPHLFSGTVICGNQFMMDGETRDRIAIKFGGLCFEMEGAGLMDDFPCLLIRGVSDYADTHKEKRWRKYAALAAAAFTTELLSVISAEGVTAMPPGTSDSASNVPLSPAPSSPQNSFLCFSKEFLQLSSISLGRLVIDTRQPWEDYCAVTPIPTQDEIGILLEPRLQNIIEASRESVIYEKFVQYFQSIVDFKATSGIIMLEKTYLLANSGNWFENICRIPNVRLWLERMIKAKWDIYMIVGIHMTRGLLPEADGEVVIAVQYRKVMFQWYWSRHVESTFLEFGGNRWEPLLLFKGSDLEDGEIEEDIVEASLKDVITEEDVKAEGNVYTLDGRVVIFG